MARVEGTPAPGPVAPPSRDADGGSDPCARLFTGPHYDVPWGRPLAFRLGQPATIAGAAATICAGAADCRVSGFIPAGERPDDPGERMFVARVDFGKPSVDPAGCGLSINYFLLVERAGKFVRARYLIETGETCMHWRGEQITVGPGLFVWRDSGYGALTDDHEWEKHHLEIDLSTLRVNGCSSPSVPAGEPLIRRPFG